MELRVLSFLRLIESCNIDNLDHIYEILVPQVKFCHVRLVLKVNFCLSLRLSN